MYTGGKFYLGGNTPWREATYLASEGHEVTVVCQNMLDDPEMEGIDVVEVQSRGEPITSLKNLVDSLTLTKPLMYRRLSDIVGEEDPDILHVHDLQRLRTGSLVARRHGVPVVADMRELYAESLKAWRGDDEPVTQLVRPHRFFRPAWRFKRLEKKLLHRVDAVISESDEAKRHYIEEHGVPEEKITTVRNVPDSERLLSYPIKEVDVQGEFVVSYIGGFTRQRVLDSAIDAMARVVEEVPDAKFYLVGNDSGEYANQLKAQRDELGLGDSVVFTGWVDFEKLPSYITASDVSLCLVQTDNLDSQCALPNKLFQSMALGTPVVVTPTEAMRRIVEKENCGLVAGSTDPEDISKELLKLYRNPELSAELGNNGKEAVEREYNFKQEGKRLIEVYNSITDEEQ